MLDALRASLRDVDEAARFISGVARQTNLLALNATIEASQTVSEPSRPSSTN